MALGYDYAQLERDGILLVVNKIACKYHRPSKFGDTLRLAIRTVRARGARIDHEYRVYRGNELLAEARKHAGVHRPRRPCAAVAGVFD